MDQVLYGIDYIEYYVYWLSFNYKNMLNRCNVLYHYVPLLVISYHIRHIQEKERKEEI